MGRNRNVPGLRKRAGIWHIEKQILGQKICESTGTGDLEAAQLILARRIEEIRQSKLFGVRPKRLFRDAATHFLLENMHLASIGDYAMHLKKLDPYIGDLPLESIHMGTLQTFIKDRKKEGIKSKSINLALSVVRRILNLAARLWRDDHGFTWLETPPLIQMLPLTDARKPYPLSWEEQSTLFRALPDHLARMCLFKVNTGCRELEVCQMKWEWEIRVPELNTSVFIIPGNQVKNREDRLVVLNRVARSVVEQVRGSHPEFVFTYRGKPLQNINSSAWRRGRKQVGLKHVRVHDLKHTFGRRLRAAGVPVETRKVLLGHRNGDITTHYSAPELEEVLEAANKVCIGQSGKTPALVILNSKTGTR
ncbi:MAG: tyrosine-type recombinase/integrase [Proteobacteria bacterium]|nr:tyrosine-type recombinase/integrase [Pseudomonadota bacterium]